MFTCLTETPLSHTRARTLVCLGMSVQEGSGSELSEVSMLTPLLSMGESTGGGQLVNWRRCRRRVFWIYLLALCLMQRFPDQGAPAGLSEKNPLGTVLVAAQDVPRFVPSPQLESPSGGAGAAALPSPPPVRTKAFEGKPFEGVWRRVLLVGCDFDGTFTALPKSRAFDEAGSLPPEQRDCADCGDSTEALLDVARLLAADDAQFEALRREAVEEYSRGFERVAEEAVRAALEKSDARTRLVDFVEALDAYELQMANTPLTVALLKNLSPGANRAPLRFLSCRVLVVLAICAHAFQAFVFRSDSSKSGLGKKPMAANAAGRGCRGLWAKPRASFAQRVTRGLAALS